MGSSQWATPRGPVGVQALALRYLVLATEMHRSGGLAACLQSLGECWREVDKGCLHLCICAWSGRTRRLCSDIFLKSHSARKALCERDGSSGDLSGASRARMVHRHVADRPTWLEHRVSLGDLPEVVLDALTHSPDVASKMTGRIASCSSRRRYAAPEITEELAFGVPAGTSEPSGDDKIPGVSILRPLRGLDCNLYENLESSFQQRYPAAKFEIICSVAEEDDPAIRVVRTLMEAYPNVDASLIVGEHCSYFGAATRIS